MYPLVTVFIPVYNGEKYIKECLDSIVNQTYSNLEILIIDDGSTDNSCKIINSYNDNRIRLLHNKRNKGIPYTRNRGLIEARGKYLALLDSDDISHISRIEKEVKFLEQNKDIDVVTTDYQVFSGKIKKNIRNGKSPEETKIYLIFGCHICNSTAMLRLNSVEKYGLAYNEKCFIAQDYEFWTQISKYGKIAHIPEVLVRYRTGHENITKKTNKTKQLERKNVISNIHNELLDFYEMGLNNNEKYLFNAFFGESVDENLSIENNIDELKILFKKLCSRSTRKFNRYLFKKVLYNRVRDVIADLPITLKEKILLYDTLIGDNWEKDIKSVIQRHFYLKLRNFLIR